MCLQSRKRVVYLPKSAVGGIADFVPILTIVLQFNEDIRASAEAIENQDIERTEQDLYQELVQKGCADGW